MLHILIKDDYIYRRGIIEIIKEHSPQSNIVEAGDTETVTAKIPHQRWDVIFFDIREMDEKNITFLKKVKQVVPAVSIVAMTESINPLFISGLMAAGAAFCLNKSCSVHEITTALDKVVEKKKHFRLQS